MMSTIIEDFFKDKDAGSDIVLTNSFETEIDLPASELKTDDTKLNYRIYELDEPMQDRVVETRRHPWLD